MVFVWADKTAGGSFIQSSVNVLLTGDELCEMEAKEERNEQKSISQLPL